MKITERKLRRVIRQVINENKIFEMIDMPYAGTSHEAGRYGTLSDVEFLNKNFNVSKSREYVKDVEHMLSVLGIASGVTGPAAMIIIAMAGSPLLGISIGGAMVTGSVLCLVLKKLIEISAGSSGDPYVDAYSKLLEKLESNGF